MLASAPQSWLGALMVSAPLAMPGAAVISESSRPSLMLKNGRVMIGNWPESAPNLMDCWPRTKPLNSMPHFWHGSHHQPAVSRPPLNGSKLFGPPPKSTTVPGWPRSPCEASVPVVASTGKFSGRIHHSRYSARTYHRFRGQQHALQQLQQGSQANSLQLPQP